MITKPTAFCKNWTTYLVFISCLCLTVSCSYKEERANRNLLEGAAIAMESLPQDALSQLRQINASLLNESDYAYFVLLQARALDKTGTSIAFFEDAVIKAKDYFIRKNETEKVVFACFELASVYGAQGKNTMALHSYLLADEWAGKADNVIPHFIYSHIPYNISALLFDEKKYDESLDYVKKALSHIDKEQCKYTQKMQVYELMALNYQCLGDMDNSFYYYEEAFAIAKLNNDIICQNRILYNKCALLYNAKEYVYAEEKVNERLPFSIQANDSIITGMLYMTLARIQAKTNRIDDAIDNIYKSKEYLASIGDDVYLLFFKVSSYKQLYLIEEQKGNNSKATQHRQQYNLLNDKLSSMREAETAELAKEMELKKLAGEAAYQVIQEKGIHRNIFRRYQSITNLIILAGGIAFLAIGAVYYIRRSRQRRKEHEYCTEEMVLYIARRKLINSITSELDHLDNSEYKQNAIEIADDTATVLRILPNVERKYGKLYRKLKADYPSFSENELTICWIACSRTLATSQIMHFMGLSAEEFSKTWKSMNDKIRTEGLKFKLRNGILFKYVDESEYRKS